MKAGRIAPLSHSPISRGSFTVSSPTASLPTTKRIFNFNAGPATLPLPVLERIREELFDWRGSGMSVMEMSHRSPEYESINAAAGQKLRGLLAIPDSYEVIFVQGGGSLQFAMVPMNLCLPGKQRFMGTMANCRDRKSTRLNSSHLGISYAVFC